MACAVGLYVLVVVAVLGAVPATALEGFAGTSLEPLIGVAGPVVGILGGLFVVLAMGRSLGNEFRLRNLPHTEPEPGKTIGIAMAVCGACSIIPLVNILTGIVYLVLWIVYWIKISGFSQMLDQVPASTGSAPIQNF